MSMDFLKQNIDTICHSTFHQPKLLLDTIEQRSIFVDINSGKRIEKPAKIVVIDNTISGELTHNYFLKIGENMCLIDFSQSDFENAINTTQGRFHLLFRKKE